MGTTHKSRRWIIVALSLMVALLAWPLAATAAGSNTFSGRATVLRATVLGTTTAISDTGPLPAEGGAREAADIDAGIPGVLAANVLHAEAFGQGTRSSSEASVANLDLTVGGHHLNAGFLLSRATAECTSAGPTTRGNSEIVGLVLDSTPVFVTGQPNQTIALSPVGTVIINEQTSSRPGDLTVSALHVIIPGVADVVISSAHADITCGGGKNCGQAHDFVTGGGFITGTPSGAHGNFGVVGGLRKGQLFGHLVYEDHGTGMKVKGTGVTAYTVTGATSRRIEGTAEINGQGGFTYQVDVADNGEPGRNDTFTIRLSNGYSATGTLTGGNIQLHKVKACK